MRRWPWAETPSKVCTEDAGAGVLEGTGKNWAYNVRSSWAVPDTQGRKLERSWTNMHSVGRSRSGGEVGVGSGGNFDLGGNWGFREHLRTRAELVASERAETQGVLVIWPSPDP